ncbi:MAG: PstS family phosphate ABC transporter substrate-binding protein [Armatimonadota bacterium]
MSISLSRAGAGVVVGALLLGVVVSVSGGVASAARRSGKRGTIRVSGAWALYPMMVKWAEEYQKLNPGVRVDVSAGGAGKGATDALGGLVDIGMISRDVRPEEEQRGGFWVSVVKDAVLPTANAANPVAKELMKRGVKRQTFVALWVGGEQMTWGQVAGVGSRDQVRVYTRSDACGAGETWAKYLGKAQEDLQGTAVYGDPGIAEAVQRDRLGIGYNNLNYAYDAATGKPVRGLMVVPIDVNGNGKLDKNESFYANRQGVKKAIASGAYPSPPARDLNLLTKGKPTGLARDFILWILRDGQRYVDEAGYIELPRPRIAAAVKKIG